MSYKAQVFNVMIASPGDVLAKRSIAREVIAEWNAVHSSRTGIVLMPISWESHAYPEMGGRPQAIINKQILRNCDLLIGVFWTRIGTPTGEFDSGTVEEIEEHLDAGKPAMLYFSDVPVQLDSVDPDQYKGLTEFKKHSRSRGLFETYSDLNDFRAKLYRQLQLTVINHEVFAGAKRNEEDEPTIMEGISKPEIPNLSKEARHLLTEAAKDPHGHILHLRHLGGTTIQVNDQSVVETGERRTLALWEAALDELLQNGLIKPVGYKGEIYEMTSRGYEVADQL